MTKTQVEVITSVQRRRRWSRAEKERIVAAAMEPGAVASEVARAAGIYPSQLFGNLDVVLNLVYFLRPLTMDSHLKICLSSRHYPHIKVPDCPEIVLERHNHQDIVHYVDSRLSPLGYDSRAHSLADRVAQKAEGVFLGVVLVVKRLNMVLDNEGTEEDLEESLRTVPKKLEDLFESLFSDFNSQTERQEPCPWFSGFSLARKAVERR